MADPDNNNLATAAGSAVNKSFLGNHGLGNIAVAALGTVGTMTLFGWLKSWVVDEQNESWLSSAFGWLLSLGAGISVGALLLNTKAGDKLYDTVMNPEKTLDDVTKAYEGLTDEAKKSADAFTVFVEDKLGIAKEEAAKLYKHLDGLDGKEGDGINAALPKIAQGTLDHLRGPAAAAKQ